MAFAPAEREGVRRLLHACEAARIVKLAEDAGAAILLYKGAVLAEVAYGGSEHREFGDIDLLVRAEDYGTVDGVLVAEGYRPWRPMPSWLLRKRGWGAPTLPYEMHYRNETTRVEVDLHSGLLPKDLGAALEERTVWRRLEQVEVCGRLVPTLGTVDTLLFLALHGTKHQWDGERYFRDFGAFARARVTPDLWRQALAEAGANGCRGVLLVAVRIAEERLGFAFPAEVSREARASRRVEGIVARYGRRSSLAPDGGAFSIAGVFEGGWRMWDTLPQRLAWLVKLAVTPNVFDYGWVQLPAPLGVLYYLARPARLAWQWLLRPVVGRFQALLR